MDRYAPETYGEAVADVYDEMVVGGPWAEAATATAAFLAELAAGGRALELGIGTGRVALPLAGRGVEVHGIDASPRMVDRLRAKPGGAGIPVTIGDFADVAAPGDFDLVFVVFNTFFNLLSQAEQLRCLRNMAAKLRPGGSVVIEVFVPDPARFDRQQGVTANRIDLDRVRLDLARHDPVAQVITSQQLLIDETGVRMIPAQVRYAWPSELDLMARLAGLTLADRFGGWHREPFTADSRSHISVYTSTGTAPLRPGRPGGDPNARA